MIARALQGDLRDWRGLGEETIESLLPELAPVEAVDGPVYAQRRLGGFDRFTITRSIAPTTVQVWVPAHGPTAALIEYDDPAVVDVDGLLGRMGPPEETQQNQRFVDGTVVEEQVHPSRGLALSVATPYADAGVDPPPRGIRQIVHVQLFRPTTVEDWRAAIGATVPLRPLPPR